MFSVIFLKEIVPYYKRIYESSYLETKYKTIET